MPEVKNNKNATLDMINIANSYDIEPWRIPSFGEFKITNIFSWYISEAIFIEKMNAITTIILEKIPIKLMPMNRKLFFLNNIKKKLNIISKYFIPLTKLITIESS